MPQHVRHNDDWHLVKRQWIKHQGSWRVIRRAWIKQDDVWEEFYRTQVVLTISTNQANFNLLSAVQATGQWDGVSPVDVVCTITTNTVLSNASDTGYAFDTGIFPDTSTLTLIIQPNAYIAGQGGKGGAGGSKSADGATGENGKDALRVRVPISIQNNGHIWGGGGGGGGGGAGHYTMTFSGGKDGTPITKHYYPIGGGGGGGQGAPDADGGSGYNYGEKGTTAAPGDGGAGSTIRPAGDSGDGGAGGAAGEVGTTGQAGLSDGPNPDGMQGAGAGGQPGRAIVGIANVTWISVGDVKGATV